MASEDSQRRGRLPEVHGLGDLRDLHQSVVAEVASKMHEIHDPGELDEVVSLRGSQRVRLEERHDPVSQVLQSVHAVHQEVLPVVVSPAVSVDPSAAEVTSQVLEHAGTGCALDHDKAWLDLPSECHGSVPLNGTAEAALAIHKPDNPSVGEESFLLVFRTARIVTVVHAGTTPSVYDIDD